MALHARALLSRVLAAAALCGAGSAIGATDPGPIVTERPSFSASPFALRRGLTQLEGGAQVTRLNGDQRAATLPFLLMRTGLYEQVELQLTWTGVTQRDDAAGDRSGAEDGAVALKWQLTDEGARTPMALYAAASLPVGDDDFGGEDVVPTLGFIWADDHLLNLFGTLLVTREDSGTTLSAGVGIGQSLGDRASAFVEYFGSGDRDRSEHNLDAGLTYLVDATLQLDAYVGVGLDGQAADGFVGLGIAKRL